MDLGTFIASWPSYNVSWRSVRDTVIPAFVCPSDSGHDVMFTDKNAGDSTSGAPVEANWARGNYAANAGWEKCEDTATNTAVDPLSSHPPPDNQVREWYRGAGPICLGYGCTFTEIVDGLSNTVMFNEIRVGVSPMDRRGTWAMGLAGASITCGNAIPGSDDYPNNPLNGYQTNVAQDNDPSGSGALGSQADQAGDQIQGCLNFWTDQLGNERMGCQYKYDTIAGDYSRQGEARSQHPGGVNTCFADGSVHFISNSISLRVWRAILSRAGSTSPDTWVPPMEINLDY